MERKHTLRKILLFPAIKPVDQFFPWLAAFWQNGKMEIQDGEAMQHFLDQ
jgi:hypothetical protein